MRTVQGTARSEGTGDTGRQIHANGRAALGPPSDRSPLPPPARRSPHAPEALGPLEGRPACALKPSSVPPVLEPPANQRRPPFGTPPPARTANKGAA